MNVHHLQGYIQSIYLVEYPDKLLLLDGCSRADTQLIYRFITQKLHREITDLKLVVVTHMHPDHAGAASELKKKTGCRIASSKHALHWYRGPDGWAMYLSDLYLARWVARRQKKRWASLFYWPWLKPDVCLQDGDTLPGFEDWQVLETPGHTDRDLSVRHVPSNRAYVADLMVRVKGRFVPPFPVFYPRRYRDSIEKVLGFEPESLWLAHDGEVVFTKADRAHLMQSIPEEPATHWRVVKRKLKPLIAWS